MISGSERVHYSSYYQIKSVSILKFQQKKCKKHSLYFQSIDYNTVLYIKRSSTVLMPILLTFGFLLEYALSFFDI